MGLGELAALATAAAWATTSLLYGASRLTAWQLNIAKNVVGASVFFLQLVAIVCITGRPLLAASWQTAALLGGSGLVGVMLGDTCYFRSIQILGPRVALIVSTMAPAFGGLLGWMWYGESVSLLCWLGILATIGGIIVVVRDPAAGNESPGLYPGKFSAGIVFGLLSALCQAGGALMSKVGMSLGDGCQPLEASFYRIGASALLMVIATPHLAIAAYRGAIEPKTRLRLFPAILIGTWLGIWLSQIAIKHAPLPVALTLMSTTPLFALLLLRIFQARPITPIAISGAVLAVAGVALTVFAQH